jgi:hypothetical protein
VWDKNGVHDLGSGGYGYLNQASQVVYLGPPSTIGSSWGSGSFYIWRNGVSTPAQVTPASFDLHDFPAPGWINDSGQFVAGDGLYSYRLSPTGACGSDVTSSLSVTRGPLHSNQSTGRFVQTLTLTNNSTTVITGPISVVFDNLTTGASVFGIRGATLCDAPQGSPYVNLSTRTLNPGTPVSYTAQFMNASGSTKYQVRVIAGSGNR